MSASPAPLSVLKSVAEKIRKADAMLAFPRLLHGMLRYVAGPLALSGALPLSESVRHGLMQAGAGLFSAQDLNAMRYGMHAHREAFEGVLQAVSAGEPVVWTEWSVTREILEGFGVSSVSPEFLVLLGYALSAEEGVRNIEEAERWGISPEDCSSQKSAVGAYLRGELPQPAAIVAASHPCDSGVSIYQVLEHITGAPVWMLDTPYARNDEALTYYTRQLYDLISFLERTLARSFDWDRLAVALEHFNDFTGYLYEIDQMGRAAPCPYWVSTLHVAWALRCSAAGSAASARFAREIYLAAKERMDAGKGVVDDERIRVLWWDVPVSFTNMSPWMAKEFGAVCISDYISHNLYLKIDTSTPDKMIEGLALAHLHHGMRRQCHGPIEYVTDELEALIDEFAPHCLIFSRHAGCKHNWAADKIISDTCKKSGLPSLFLSVDIFDPRDVSEEEIQESIAGFFRSSGLA